MRKTALLSLLVFLFLGLNRGQALNEPPLRKDFDNGPTVLFEQKEFVDYVTIYILLDKSKLKSAESFDAYLHNLENRLGNNGAVCQTLWHSAVPEAPWNFKQQSFLIARFTVKDFENHLTDILSHILSAKFKGRFLHYDQNALRQSQKIKGLQQDSLRKRSVSIEYSRLDPVTLYANLYLFFTGKINTFTLLRSINRILKEDVETVPASTVDSDLRYWLFVFQRFVINILKNRFSSGDSDCKRILAPIDLARNKILLNTDFEFNRDSLLAAVKNGKPSFKSWYFNEYLKSFGNLAFDDDYRCLLNLYSACYLPEHSLFEINLKLESNNLKRMLSNPQEFIEYDGTK